MNQYQDGLNNETEIQIMSTYRRPITDKSKQINSDMGTMIVAKNRNSNYNSNVNENINMNMNTFRQVENDCAPKAHTSQENQLLAKTSSLAFESIMAAQPKTNKPAKKGFKRLNTQAIYNEINVQVSNVRDMGRYMRCRIHVSLKEDTDRQYTVFLSGAATTSKHELIAGAKGVESVLNVINDFMQRRPGCMIARFHYKPVNGYITDFHKKNIKSCMMMIYENDSMLEAELYLLGEYITIPLDKELTKKQQQYYQLAGLYRATPDQMTDEEEFE